MRFVSRAGEFLVRRSGKLITSSSSRPNTLLALDQPLAMVLGAAPVLERRWSFLWTAWRPGVGHSRIVVQRSGSNREGSSGAEPIGGSSWVCWRLPRRRDSSRRSDPEIPDSPRRARRRHARDRRRQGVPWHTRSPAPPARDQSLAPRRDGTDAWPPGDPAARPVRLPSSTPIEAAREQAHRSRPWRGMSRRCRRRNGRQ